MGCRTSQSKSSLKSSMVVKVHMVPVNFHRSPCGVLLPPFTPSLITRLNVYERESFY